MKSILMGIKLFVYYSMLGYLLENTFSIFTRSNFDSGISKGPFTPLYFFGFLIIWGVHYLLRNMPLGTQKVVLYFVIMFVLLSLLEYVGGVLIEKFLHKTWWNYEHYKFHIGKYISVEVSIVWALLATIFNFYLIDIVTGIILNMNTPLTLILFFLYILDFLLGVFGL